MQEVKIDRSFVFGLGGPTSSYASAALIRSIITIGENLGLRIVAEGVEDAVVLEALRGLGCDLAQGYHIGRPGHLGAADRPAGRRPVQAAAGAAPGAA